MGFASQARSAEFMLKNSRDLENDVCVAPEDFDKDISMLKLSTMAVKIGKLTAEQQKFLASRELGT